MCLVGKGNTFGLIWLYRLCMGIRVRNFLGIGKRSCNGVGVALVMEIEEDIGNLRKIG
jgi:hypothetical protein